MGKRQRENLYQPRSWTSASSTDRWACVKHENGLPCPSVDNLVTEFWLIAVDEDIPIGGDWRHDDGEAADESNVSTTFILLLMTLVCPVDKSVLDRDKWNSQVVKSRTENPVEMFVQHGFEFGWAAACEPATSIATSNSAALSWARNPTVPSRAPSNVSGK